MTERTGESVERALQDAVARGDAAIAAVRPVLRHFLAGADTGLLSDEIVARVRGMTCHLAEQLLFAQAAAADVRDVQAYIDARQEALAQALSGNGELLAHAHGLAVEAELAERLPVRAGIDAVLTPLVQDLAAADDPDTARLAMAVVAAQARFQQQQRRMELPLKELPGHILHAALLVLRAEAHGDDVGASEIAERDLRAAYDESAGRLGLLARLVLGLGAETGPALQLAHAGLSIFATALSLALRQDRCLVLLSFADSQGARLALSLRATGLDFRSIAEQALSLHPDRPPLDAIDLIAPDRAAALLEASHAEWVP